MNELAGLLKTLTPIQLDFVRVRLQSASDAEAARDVGIAPGTISRWKAEGVPIDEVVQLAKLDSVEVARENLRRLASAAVEALRAELQGTRRRLDAAKEVLDRVGLEAGSKVDVTSGGKALAIAAEDLTDDDLAAIVGQPGQRRGGTPAAAPGADEPD